jgi:hypothetical protein
MGSRAVDALAWNEWLRLSESGQRRYASAAELMLGLLALTPIQRGDLERTRRGC